MTDLRDQFIIWYHNLFQQSELYQRMTETVEDSPWHRERNVGVHTDMVVSQYLSITPDTWTSATLHGAFACAFHDVGKPDSEEIKFREDRGEYRAYNGHEKVSARLWEDYAVTHFKHLQSSFGLDKKDIFAVGFLIEHHLPWGLKKPEKRFALAKTLLTFLGDEIHIFFAVLISDTWGRISDNQEDKRRKALLWIKEFSETPPIEEKERNKDKILYLPIGASGCGKSTYYKDNFLGDMNDSVLHYSCDDIRLELYLTDDEKENLRENYKHAFTRQIEDSEFSMKAQRIFIDKIKTGKDIYVDNTNLTRNRRAFFVQEAKRHGYKVVAIMFPLTLRSLYKRQSERQDKLIGCDVSKRHYMSLQLPQIGEVDEIWIEDIANDGS